MAFTRIGSVALSSGPPTESYATWSIVDRTRGYIYVLTAKHLAKNYLVRVSTSTFLRVGAIDLGNFDSYTDFIGDGSIYMDIDEADGYLYILHKWVLTGNYHYSRITKVNLSTFTVSTYWQEQEQNYLESNFALDTTNNMIYVGVFSGDHGYFRKIQTSDMTVVTSKDIGQLRVPTALWIDSVNSLIHCADINLHYPSQGIDSVMREYRISDLVLAGSFSLGTFIPAHGQIIDGSSYIVGATVPGTPAASFLRSGVVRKYNLSYTSSYSEIGRSNSLSNLSYISSGGIFYIIEDTTISTVHKIDRNTFSIIESLNLSSGDIGYSAVSIDSVDELLYFGDNSDPCALIKIDIALDPSTPGLSYSCSATEGSATLEFNDLLGGGVETRVIENSADGLTGWSTVDTISGTNLTYGVTGIVDEVTEYYRYKNVYKSVESSYSEATGVLCAWHPWTPAKPSNVDAVKSTDLADNIITWDYEIYNNCGNIKNYIDGFKIYRSSGGIYSLVQTITDTSIRTWTDVGVGATVYTYKMLAYNSHRDSGYTAVIQVDLGTPTNFFNGEYMFDGTIDFSGN